MMKSPGLFSAALGFAAALFAVGGVIDAANASLIPIGNPGFDATLSGGTGGDTVTTVRGATAAPGDPLPDGTFTYTYAPSSTAADPTTGTPYTYSPSGQGVTASIDNVWSLTGVGGVLYDAIDYNAGQGPTHTGAFLGTGTVFSATAASLQQTLTGQSFSPNTLYTLTISVSYRLALGGAGDGTGIVTVDLLAGASPVTPTSVTYTPPTVGNTSLYTLTLLTGAIAPTGTIGIRLNDASSGADTVDEAVFDNIALDAEVPEPASLGLIGVGAVLVMPRRRRV